MDVLTKAREMCKEIQKSEAFIEMMEASKRGDANEALQEKISNFNLKKIALDREGSREEKNSDKIAQYDREMREVYQSIMQEPDMIAYSEAKKKVDDMMTQVQLLINFTLRGDDPETVEIPEAGACSGDCSSCAGCH